MGLLRKICRNSGLLVHGILQPLREERQKQELRRTVEEEQPSPRVTLRRTTIEEIEIHRDDQKD